MGASCGPLAELLAGDAMIGMLGLDQGAQRPLGIAVGAASATRLWTCGNDIPAPSPREGDAAVRPASLPDRPHRPLQDRHLAREGRLAWAHEAHS